MTYSGLADITGMLHALFVLFVVGGQFLILAGWIAGRMWSRNFVFRVLHLVAIGFVVLEAWFGIVCPLTAIESRLRMKAGIVGHSGGFIAYWLNRLLYFQAPAWVFATAYTAFAALVLITFIIYPPRRRTALRP